MKKSRQEMNIRCHSCPVSRLCLAHQLPSKTLEWFDQSLLFVKIFEPGEHLFRPNEKITHTFAIRYGMCKECSTNKEGAEQIYEFYSAGDIVGLEHANEAHYPSVEVIATERTLACMIPVSMIQSPKPSLYPRLFHLICQKLKQQHHYPVCTNAKKRVASFFIVLITRERKKFSKNTAIPLHLTHLDISRKIGIAQETLCRILRDFSIKKLLVVKNRLICSYDLEALEELN